MGSGASGLTVEAVDITVDNPINNLTADLFSLLDINDDSTLDRSELPV